MFDKKMYEEKQKRYNELCKIVDEKVRSLAVTKCYTDVATDSLADLYFDYLVMERVANGIKDAFKGTMPDSIKTILDNAQSYVPVMHMLFDKSVLEIAQDVVGTELNWEHIDSLCKSKDIQNVAELHHIVKQTVEDVNSHNEELYFNNRTAKQYYQDFFKTTNIKSMYVEESIIACDKYFQNMKTKLNTDLPTYYESSPKSQKVFFKLFDQKQLDGQSDDEIYADDSDARELLALEHELEEMDKEYDREFPEMSLIPNREFREMKALAQDIIDEIAQFYLSQQSCTIISNTAYKFAGNTLDEKKVPSTILNLIQNGAVYSQLLDGMLDKVDSEYIMKGLSYEEAEIDFNDIKNIIECTTTLENMPTAIVEELQIISSYGDELFTRINKSGYTCGDAQVALQSVDIIMENANRLCDTNFRDTFSKNGAKVEIPKHSDVELSRISDDEMERQIYSPNKYMC